MMDDVAFSDWPGQPVDLAGSNPWLPAYGYQTPATLLDKDDFLGNPDAALFLHGSTSPHYVFLETIVEETSDDLRSESDRSGSRASPAGWLATDSESGSVIHVDLEGIEDLDSGSESELACPAKRRRQDPTLLSIAGMFSDSDSNHSLSRSSSLLQFETLEKHCQDIYSSSPSILSLFSQDSLEQQRKSNDLSPDSLDRCHSDSESESDYYKTLKIDVASKSKRFRDSLFYNTKRLSDSDSKSDDSDSRDSDETLQVASRSNSCKSVQNLKSCRSFDSLHVKTGRKDKMSAENLSEDSGYSDHLCNYMKNKSSSIPNLQVAGGISLPEKSTTKTSNELKKANTRKSNEDMDLFRLKNIKVSDGFDAYDGEPGLQNFASHFGSSYQDLTMFERYEPLIGFRTPLIDRFMVQGGVKRGVLSPDWCRVPQTDVLKLGTATECVAGAKISAAASASEPTLSVASCEPTVDQPTNTLFEPSISVPKDLNLAGQPGHDPQWAFCIQRESIAAKNWDLAHLPPAENYTENSFLEEDNASETMRKVNFYRQEGSNVTAMVRQQRDSSSVSSGGSDISMPRYRREGSYVKAISDYLNITEITDDEQDKSFHDPPDTTTKILDLDSQIQKAISESSIQSFSDDTTKIRMLFHSTPITKRNVTSTPNLFSSIDEKPSFLCGEMRRSMQNVPRKSSLVDRSTSSSGVSEPDDRTITSRTFSGSGSTTKGVHFCPIVAEVSWKDSSSSSSSEEMSSYSVSSTPHEGSPQESPERELPVAVKVSPPLMPAPRRRSSSEPELPQTGETDKETEYIFIPLNPQKWASSTPSVSQSSESSKGTGFRVNGRGRGTNGPPKVGVRILAKTQVINSCGKNEVDQHDGGEIKSEEQQTVIQLRVLKSAPQSAVDVNTPTGGHVVRPPPRGVQQRGKQQPEAAAAVSVMDPVLAHRPVTLTTSSPTKQTRAGKISGFLSRFASFRFSTRKSSEGKSPRKKAPPSSPVSAGNYQQPVATEKDYIYIPLKGPLDSSSESAAGNDKKEGRDAVPNGTNNNNGNNEVQIVVGEIVSSSSSSTDVAPRSVQGVSAGKPPLPKAPPRVVGACAKRRGAGGGIWGAGGESIDCAGVGGAAVGRNACSMEPMGLIETDLDTEVTVITGGTGAHVKTRSLMNLGGAEPPPQTLLAATDNAHRPHKSMEFLLDKQNLKAVEPPENELQKSTGERVMSEHQLRVQRSLQKLTVPEWYKQNQVPREGFILKKQTRSESRWTGTGTGAIAVGTGTSSASKTPSLSSLGSGHSPVLLSPTPHGHQQPFTRWSTSKLNSTTSKLNSAASSPCASTRSSFNHRTTANGGISPSSIRSSFSYCQPYLGWRSQERLARPRTPAERLATSFLPATQDHQDLAAYTTSTHLDLDNPSIHTSIKEVTSAIVHYVSGLQPESSTDGAIFDSPRLRSDHHETSSQRSASPQSRGSQKLCWLESSFVGTRPLDSPQTPVSLTGPDSTSQISQVSAPASQLQMPPTTLRLDLQKNINNGESLRA